MGSFVATSSQCNLLSVPSPHRFAISSPSSTTRFGLSLLPRSTVVASLGRRPDVESYTLGSNPNLSYTAYLARSSTSEAAETYPVTEEPVDEKVGVNGTVEPVLTENKPAAIIHDFCFGIPFGGLVLGVGLISFIFSRNPTTLATTVLAGGSLLALSTTSLKVWRQGKSCLPFILGQAVLAAVLCWKNFQTYSVTKQLFPSGVYGSLSGAMLCFYLYVMLAGGNPPPKKKLKSEANYASS